MKCHGTPSECTHPPRNSQYRSMNNIHRTKYTINSIIKCLLLQYCVVSQSPLHRKIQHKYPTQEKKGIRGGPQLPNNSEKAVSTPNYDNLAPPAPATWSVKTRGAPSRHCRGARVYRHTLIAMHDIRPPPAPSSALQAYPKMNALRIRQHAKPKLEALHSHY